MRLRRCWGIQKNIEHTNELLEDYDRQNNTFDYILMHNSINHIDEESCIVLKESQAAREKYLIFFSCMAEISEQNTRLIVCDCSRNNFFNELGLTNPMMKTLEWHKRQNPKFWATLLSKKGFKLQSIDWTSPKILGIPGKLLLSNSIMSYFTRSHFRIELLYSD